MSAEYAPLFMSSRDVSPPVLGASMEQPDQPGCLSHNPVNRRENGRNQTVPGCGLTHLHPGWIEAPPPASLTS